MYCELVGIFDGHGGPNAANYAATHIKSRLNEAGLDDVRMDENISFNVQQIVDHVFVLLDQEIRLRYPKSGTTATVFLRLFDIEHKKYHTMLFNVGDSRGLAVDNKGNFVSKTPDHRFSVEYERKRAFQRMKKRNPKVAKDCKYVHPYGAYKGRGLTCSRVLGDRHIPQPFVTPHPSVRVLKDPFMVILGTDGVWDWLCDRSVFERSLDGPTLLLGSVSQAHRDRVKESGRWVDLDNHSVMVIRLKTVDMSNAKKSFEKLWLNEIKK